MTKMMSPRTEDVIEYLIHELANIPPDKPRATFELTQFAHLFIPHAVPKFWHGRGIGSGELKDEHWEPFYDAAWQLARIGVLRPGRIAPRGQDTPRDNFGEHWSITAFGFDWLADAAERPFVDMGRMANVLRDFIEFFGEGYGQRAVEAVRTYRTVNYLSACTMAGAAAESILLAVATAKSNDEKKILERYRGRNGRREVTKYVVVGRPDWVKSQFEEALQILKYWRDDASHGEVTTITEVDAYLALNRLLRLARFASDRWDDLTGQKDAPERDSGAAPQEQDRL